jgi:dTDP-4-dehydrorhamnose 3,5-epimerase-like enzyme
MRHAPSPMRGSAALPMTLFDTCRILNLPKVYDPRGSLSFVYNNEHIPFKVARTFFTYDVPGGQDRGAHAHIETHQFLVAVMGAFDVRVTDGIQSKTFRLERAYYGLYIPPMIWAEQLQFSSGGICLVLASHPYEEKDYIRKYDDYLSVMKIAASI